MSVVNVIIIVLAGQLLVACDAVEVGVSRVKMYSINKMSSVLDTIPAFGQRIVAGIIP